MIILVATPIGNLSDITLRALEVLKEADLVLCEDTRISTVLLKKYSIDTPLRSFHKFSEKKLEDGIIRDLKLGKKIALISDAGTPGINDPGQKLVSRCHKEGIQVSSVPGPCSPIAALTLSGFHLEKFQFIGFLPKKPGERKDALVDAFFYSGVTACFESPHRIHTTLEEIAKWGPDQEVAIVREMTKHYEEVLRGKAKDLMGKEIRGEIVLIIEGDMKLAHPSDAKKHVEMLQKTFDLEKNEAIKLASELRGESKKDLYRCLISEENL